MQYNIQSLSFQITEFNGDNPGLTELEIYERRENVDLDFISGKYSSCENTNIEVDVRNHVAVFAEQCSFEIERFFMRVKGRLIKDFWRFLKSTHLEVFITALLWPSE